MYTIRGKVRGGKGRGKALGFPTANVRISKKIPEGIYISKVKINNEIFSSLTFIGAAKTFADKNYQAEVYILSFDKNIYNEWVSIQLLQKIRDNKKFASGDELVLQIRKDEEVARAYFKEKGEHV